MTTFVHNGNQSIETPESKEGLIPPPYCGEDYYEHKDVSQKEPKPFSGWTSPQDEFRVDL